MKELPTDFHRFTPIYDSSKFQVQGYVLSGHDFRRDSAKLMQASLALAAPKIQGSKLPTDFHRFTPIINDSNRQA